ncbi:uncharacterized protein LOC114939856 [Nylanderia fulva]|uniref:uncharacterized protein LOC114927891 n=1 Tax=Nylanderia fulva TaxID=613905 RepID=UPI0010FB4F0D|nr:uncharacterized protein LOC114927891 [Nylanderia fulva]XP_029156955.1 uncharacterized protein LOC114929549 [Nylanderia fulva]XP_029170127.1 uncharacterized protein LOC114939856 [Nylanderia fulva]
MRGSREIFRSLDGSSAILWFPAFTGRIRYKSVLRKRRSATVIFDEIVVTSCYISPNVNSHIFEKFLEDLYPRIPDIQAEILIGGDFNAKSAHWGSRYSNRQGDLVMSWAASCGLVLVNSGNLPTCVRPQGESIVDLTWASPSALTRLKNWRVMDDAISLSDHQYIAMVFVSQSSSNEKVKVGKRWNFAKIDKELFTEAVEFTIQYGPEITDEYNDSPDEYAFWITRIVTEACDTSAPICRGRNVRRNPHWWTDEISSLRKAAIAARRLWFRGKSRKLDNATIKNRCQLFKLAKKKLRNAIKQAKNRAWQNLILTINKDPWGLPYKLVLNKLRKTGLAISEQLDVDLLNKKLDELFPHNILSGRQINENSSANFE